MMTCIIERKTYKLIFFIFPMEEIQLKEGLRDLKNSLRRIKALVAWEQLKQTETRPNQPPGFRIYDSTIEDLQNEYSLFLSKSMQIQSILNKKSLTISKTKLHNIKRQLVKIKQQAHVLNLHQRFSNR